MNLFFLLLLTSLTTHGPDDRIAETLLQNGLAGKDQSFLIVLREQADLSVVRNFHGKAVKGQQAFNLLKAKASSTQGPVLQLLAEEKALAQPYFVINMVRSFGDLELIRKVATLPSVAYIAADAPVRVSDYKEEMESPLRGFADLTWGLQKIQADSVWAMGYTGQNVVIGGQDTGYEWDHPALVGTYRGNTNGQVDHNYNWHDAIHALNPINGDTTNNPLNNPCGLDSPAPCDDNNHGTHTMGTMAGLDSTLQIGVAPDARWIGCRNMERGWGMPSTYIECFEWFLAPTDLNNENPDPDKAPHVIANSWGCPEVEGCDPSNFALMEMVVNNLKTAGVVVVVSAGNSGSGCSSVSSPAAIFESSFTIGATRDNDTIANFSSRGPVLVDGSGRMKPDVSAPGVNVRSSIPGGGYANFSGTSMAGPHVAGAVALIISARPDLAGEVDVIEDLLKNTAQIIAAADTCGGVPGTETPNNTYGWGRIDVFEAVKLALKQLSTTTPSTTLAASVLPNPFNDLLQITWPGMDGIGMFQLYDLSGRMVFQQQLTLQDAALVTLSMPTIHPGFYSYRIIAGNHLSSGKLLRS
jgi:serine protease AprX